MKEEELLKLSKKLGMNKGAVEFALKEDAKSLEKQVVEAAEAMGLLKKNKK